MKSIIESMQLRYFPDELRNVNKIRYFRSVLLRRLGRILGINN